MEEWEREGEVEGVNLAVLPLYEMPSDKEVREMSKSITAATKKMAIGEALWSLLDYWKGGKGGGKTGGEGEGGGKEGEEEEDVAKVNRGFIDQLGREVTFQSLEISIKEEEGEEEGGEGGIRLGRGGISPRPLEEELNNGKISISAKKMVLDNSDGRVTVFDLTEIEDFLIIPERALVSVTWDRRKKRRKRRRSRGGEAGEEKDKDKESGEEGGEEEAERGTMRITSTEVLDIYTALIYYLNAQMVEEAKEKTRER